MVQLNRTAAQIDATMVRVDGMEDGAQVNTVDSVAGKTGAVILVASDITDFDTEVSNNSAVTANTAKVTNATHTGDVTGDAALTIAAGAVDEAKCNASINASLNLADSATQPGDNVSTLTNDENFIPSNTTGVTGADQVVNAISLTQAEYDAITPVAGTLYLIDG